MKVERESMPVRCSGCAFTAGTEAHRHDVTVLTAELCVQAGEPFFCHANAIADKLPKGRERLCRGYLDERAKRGPQPAWKKAIATEGLRLMEEAAAGREVMEEATARLLVAGTRASMEPGA